MAVHGYITYAAHNRRYTAWLVLAYILAFELIGAFALTMPLLMADHEHTILSNPVGYAVRYALPIAAVAGLMFWLIYRGHARAVTQTLGVRIVSRQDDPRFIDIAEEQGTALGVRLPRFGIIEADAPNAVTIGEGPTMGLIAVTRGLLDALDDDELAAVLAHKALHIRQGDTKLLASNHALIRTAVILQTNNPLRIENWRQAIIPILIPPLLLVLLASSAATMVSMQLARAARRGLKLSRDYVADGEAIRVTRFPEALIGAIEKVSGRGTFPGSARVEGMLFDGSADREGDRRAVVTDRLDAIRALGAELMNPARQRRDSRVPTQPKFGRRPRASATRYPCDASGRPLERPSLPARGALLLLLTDIPAFREWQNACVAWEEWRLSDRRNAIGLAPKVMLPLSAACLVMLVIYWPKDGDLNAKLSRIVTTFNPIGMVDIARMTNSGPFCTGPSYPDGKCPGAKDALANAAGIQGAFSNSGRDNRRNAAIARPPQPADPAPLYAMPMMLFIVVILAIFKPDWLRILFGQAKREASQSATTRPVDDDAPDRFDSRIQEKLNDLASRPDPFGPRSAVREFGRRVV